VAQQLPKVALQPHKVTQQFQKVAQQFQKSPSSLIKLPNRHKNCPTPSKIAQTPHKAHQSCPTTPPKSRPTATKIASKSSKLLTTYVILVLFRFLAEFENRVTYMKIDQLSHTDGDSLGTAYLSMADSEPISFKFRKIILCQTNRLIALIDRLVTILPFYINRLTNRKPQSLRKPFLHIVGRYILTLFMLYAMNNRTH
jgi:hypothetical protein